MFLNENGAIPAKEERANDQSDVIVAYLDSSARLPHCTTYPNDTVGPDEYVVREEWDALPHEWIGLVAIHSETKLISSCVFAKSDTAQAIPWILNKQSQGSSIYFHQGDVPSTLGSVRARKEDLINAHYLWCDIDIGSEGDREIDRIAALQRIDAFEKETGIDTTIEDSGNGFYVKIGLAEPSPDQAKIEQLNTCLIEILKGDQGTQNFDRLLGFPGTINFPSPRKQKLGRVARRRSVCKKSSRTYSLSELGTKLVPKPHDGVPQIVPDDTVNLDDLAVSPSFREVIRDGNRKIAPFLKGDGSTDRSSAIWFVICEGIACGLTNEEIAGLLLNRSNSISGRVIEKGGISYVRAELVRAEKKNKPLSCNPATPLPCAKLFKRYCFDDRLYCVEGSFYAWNGRLYDEIDESTMRAIFTEFFSRQRYWPEGSPRSFNLTKGKLSELLEALRNVSHFKTESFPKWLSRAGHKPDERHLLICHNCVIDMATGNTFEHTPELLSPFGVEFEYDPSATCPQWLNFLEQVIPDAVDRACFQEVCGYLLTPDTSRHKIFYLYGPPRSGKSTALRVLEQLAGKHNCVSKSTHQLSGEFSRQDLIGKLICVITDSRINQIREKASILELFLSISGEDSQSINRKHEKHWNGKLPTRFIMASNELPQFSDSGTALAKRLIVLSFPNSFYGKEDLTLESHLLDELPGILNWAMEGRRRLENQGCFTESQRSKEFQRDIEDMSSPLREFVEDKCELSPGAQVSSKEIYDAYTKWWSDEMGQQNPISYRRFSTDLRSAQPSVRTARPYCQIRQETVRGYSGIRLKCADEQIPF